MATTTYTKQYILERIAARRVSLTATLKEHEAEAIDLAEAIDEALNEWTYTVDELLYDARRINVLNVDDARRKQELIKQALGTHIPGEGPVPFGGPTTPAEELNKRSRDARQSQQTVTRIEAELDAIEHVSAYLQGTPVDEFTLTQLKTLGLLDFVKFDLTRSKEQR